MKERPILFNGDMVRAILDGRKTQTRRPVKPQPWKDEFGECSYGKLVGPELFYPGIIDSEGDLQPAKEQVYGVYSEDGEWGAKCPFGKPGDQLWVRETFCELDQGHWYDRERPKDWYCRDGYLNPVRNGGAYKADTDEEGDRIRKEYGYKWKPSIHMPRWASRIQLEITDVRVERVQEISEEDCFTEGIPKWANADDIANGHYLDRPIESHWCDNCRGEGTHIAGSLAGTTEVDCAECDSAFKLFRNIWSSIYEAKGLGWNANPWVWVVEFKRVN